MMRYLLLTMLLLTVGCEDTAPPSAIASSEPQPTAPSESDADKTTAKAESPSEPDQAAPAPSANAESNKDKVVKSEAEWKKLLSPEEYHILREAGTERPFANKYDKHFEPGAYACAACGQVLFESETKLRLAGVLRRQSRRPGDPPCGQLTRHATHRSPLRPLRLPPRPHLQ